MSLPTDSQDLCAMGWADVPFPDYLSAPGVGSSGLKMLLKSPAHYKADLESEDRETPAKRLGRIIHKAVLEPDDFRAVVSPDCEKRSKSGKAAHADAEAQAIEQRAVLVTADELKVIQGIKSSVWAHPSANALLSGPGRSEVSGWWMDPLSGELCKMRADWLRDDHIIVDLKTTEDASPEKFAKSVANYGYDLQSAHYSNGHKAISGALCEAFIFIAVEKAPPYAVGVYAIGQDDLDRANLRRQEALMKLADAKCARKWTAYSDRIEELQLPAWAKR